LPTSPTVNNPNITPSIPTLSRQSQHCPVNPNIAPSIPTLPRQSQHYPVNPKRYPVNPNVAPYNEWPPTDENGDSHQRHPSKARRTKNFRSTGPSINFWIPTNLCIYGAQKLCLDTNWTPDLSGPLSIRRCRPKSGSVGPRYCTGTTKRRIVFLWISFFLLFSSSPQIIQGGKTAESNGEPQIIKEGKTSEV
jgi:hypothetical protein